MFNINSAGKHVADKSAHAFIAIRGAYFCVLVYFLRDSYCCSVKCVHNGVHIIILSYSVNERMVDKKKKK